MITFVVVLTVSAALLLLSSQRDAITTGQHATLAALAIAVSWAALLAGLFGWVP